MIELEKNIDPLLSLTIQDFSYSRLTTFLDCELKYFHSYIVKEPQEFGPAAKLGNIIHKALEITLENGQPINSVELLLNYRAARFEYDPDNLIPETMIDNGEAMLREYVELHPGPQEVTDKELPFSFILGNARFNGFIDYVAVYDDYVHCRDYKSGAKEIPKKDIADNLQLGIYSLYLKYLYPDKKIYSELYYLKTSRAKGHWFSDEDLEQVELKLSNLSKGLLQTEDFKATKDASKCNWCSYAKDGTCNTGNTRLKKNSFFNKK